MNIVAGQNRRGREQMPDDAVKPALRAALRHHEIGDKSPYQLFFAKKGNSGGSFGFMQGDLATGQPHVQNTFRQCLAAAGFSASEIDGLINRLSVHLLANPLSAAEAARVNAALAAGSQRVDAMDELILKDVFDDLDTCIATAAAKNRRIDPKAQLYIAMWINMSGKPTKLLTWLSGGDPQLAVPVPPAAAVVDAAAIESYLHATKYYQENPGNFPHLQQSAAKGAALLP
jgi:hypothetical protein